MDTSIFPRHTVPLSNGGIQQLIKLLEGNPSLTEEVARQLETDPKSLIEQVFQLTARQKKAFDSVPDATLRQQVLPLVQALRAGEAARFRFVSASKADPKPEDTSSMLWGLCACIEIVW